MSSDTQRPYDVVVFGATGFTGRLTAEYLAQHDGIAPARWAIAGRSAGKLAEIKRALTALAPGASAVGVLEASVEDPASLARMAAQTRVVLTTVGPFARYGEPVAAACVEAGAHYVDITGEPQFVEQLTLRHHERARARGVRLVSCCGFDSIPHDLGVRYTVGEIPGEEPLVIEGFVRAKGAASGGTARSALEAMGDLRAMRSRARPPRVDDPSGRRVRAVRARLHYEPAVKAWACPLPTIDPLVVLRSARALEEYGADFRYGHYAAVKRLGTVALAAVGLGGAVALSQFGPTRALLARALPSPGEGPSAEQRAKHWFRVTFIARRGGRTVVTRVRGGDPGYSETAKMVAESALCLAQDGGALPDAAGVLTTAVAMGAALTARLVRRGIVFEVLSRE